MINCYGIFYILPRTRDGVEKTKIMSSSFAVAKLSSHSDLPVSAKCVAADRDRVPLRHISSNVVGARAGEKEREKWSAFIKKK